MRFGFSLGILLNRITKVAEEIGDLVIGIFDFSLPSMSGLLPLLTEDF